MHSFTATKQHEHFNDAQSEQRLSISEKGSAEVLALKFSKIYTNPALIEHSNA